MQRSMFTSPNHNALITEIVMVDGESYLPVNRSLLGGRAGIPSRGTERLLAYLRTRFPSRKYCRLSLPSNISYLRLPCNRVSRIHVLLYTLIVRLSSASISFSKLFHLLSLVWLFLRSFSLLAVPLYRAATIVTTSSTTTTTTAVSTRCCCCCCRRYRSVRACLGLI